MIYSLHWVYIDASMHYWRISGAWSEKARLRLQSSKGGSLSRAEKADLISDLLT
jgi:hypothetical protein